MDNFVDRLEDRLAAFASRINELEDKIEELERPKKKQRESSNIIRIEDIPDRMNFHQFRELVQKYGETYRIQMSKTTPRWAEFMYKNPIHADILMEDADKLGMKIFFK